MWLFRAADSRLGYAHSPGQLNLGQFGCLPQLGQLAATDSAIISPWSLSTYGTCLSLWRRRCVSAPAGMDTRSSRNSSRFWSQPRLSPHQPPHRHRRSG